MGTKLLDSESEGPTEMTLGTKKKKTSCSPTEGGTGNSLDYFPSCPVSFAKRKRLSLAAKVVAETPQVPSWGLFVTCNVISICLFC